MAVARKKSRGRKRKAGPIRVGIVVGVAAAIAAGVMSMIQDRVTSSSKAKAHGVGERMRSLSEVQAAAGAVKEAWVVLDRVVTTCPASGATPREIDDLANAIRQRFPRARDDLKAALQRLQELLNQRKALVKVDEPAIFESATDVVRSAEVYLRLLDRRSGDKAETRRLVDEAGKTFDEAIARLQAVLEKRARELRS
jgi:tetratricopeptide (TPR) repeat protein